jgi:PAS domain S-box-containing protein
MNPTRPEHPDPTDPIDPADADVPDPFREWTHPTGEGLVIHEGPVILFVNPGFRDLFGLSPDFDLSTRAFHHFLATDTHRRMFEACRIAASGAADPVVSEGRGLRTDGRTIDLELITLPVQYSGRTVCQTLVRDVTARKRMEERLINAERLSATGKLAFNIAHEINNPLGGIVTYTHLLLEELAEGASVDEIRQLAEKVLKLANRCKIIVSALLDFARDDRTDRQEVDLNLVIRETLTLLQGHLILHGLDIRLDLAPNLPSIQANRVKIEQVLMNLTVNAAEAMDGRGRLFIGTRYDAELRRVSIRIQDTGPGIPEEYRKLLFEPFFSTKPRGRGTGLGLAISHGIIQRHKGRIEVESLPGLGTTFTILLPV